jgi:2-methylfumaryl-CoA hydratase
MRRDCRSSPIQRPSRDNSGGSHVNPTFAGDTITGRDDGSGQDKYGISRGGAPRLRMTDIKDAPEASIVFPDAGQNRQAHPSNVVLDLDYTIVIPGGTSVIGDTDKHASL